MSHGTVHFEVRKGTFESWKWRAGRSILVIEGPDGRKHREWTWKVAGCQPQDLERGQWKQSPYAAAMPSDVKAYIEKNLRHVGASAKSHGQRPSDSGAGEYRRGPSSGRSRTASAAGVTGKPVRRAVLQGH